jgi:hypothetical protein
MQDKDEPEQRFDLPTHKFVPYCDICKRSLHWQLSPNQHHRNCQEEEKEGEEGRRKESKQLENKNNNKQTTRKKERKKEQEDEHDEGSIAAQLHRDAFDLIGTLFDQQLTHLRTRRQ